jgi:sec-independent protein translocase protein TatA
MFGLGLPELLLILLAIVLLFGSTKLPQLGKGMGEAIRSFRKALREPQEESKSRGAKEPAGK